MKIDKATDNIINVRLLMQQVFFRDFISNYGQEEGLKYSHIITMIIISHKGPCAMSKVSERINLEKGSFTSVCDRLIRNGYIEKKQDQSDRRIYKIQLTARGIEYTKEFKKAHQEYISGKLDILDEQEKINYYRAISEILNITEKIANS